MRAHPAEYEMAAPGSLEGVLQLLEGEPGRWMPVAGGTEIMVLYGAGRLASHRLVSLWDVPDLRTIEEGETRIRLGGGCTFSQIRNCSGIQKHFPLLAQSAAWTGSIANQNRATIAGNLANASPAADSPPALLAYDAELELISARGRRTLPYSRFHLGYKRTALQPDELILAIILHKRWDGYFSGGRKVGARNAQAISKVCVAGVGRMERGCVADLRIGMGSVAPVPLRLTDVEAAVIGREIDGVTIAAARRALDHSIAPIDDIRSVAGYRRWVAGNLIEEFLLGLGRAESLNNRLTRWNSLSQAEAAERILPCCGSSKWARTLAGLRPFASEADVMDAAGRVWLALDADAWDEAFRSHPRIGERKAPAAGESAQWSEREQSGVDRRDAGTMAELARGNAEYEARFGRTFLIHASGNSAAKMLAALRRRMKNDAETELREAVEQQRQITQLRLKKWLAE